MSRKFDLSNEEFFPIPRRPENSKYVNIPCEQLIADEDNVVIYGDEDESKISSLAEDIKKNGFKGAILAYPEDGLYRIESGHRRFEAAKLAGLNAIPVIITDPPKSDAERKIRLISMNLHSREYKPSTTVSVIETLYEANREILTEHNHPCLTEEILSMTAKQMEVSVPTIQKYRQYSKLSDSLKALGDAGIAWSALISASSLNEEAQNNIAEIIKNEINKSGIENISRQWIIRIIGKKKMEHEEVPKSSYRRRDGGKIVARFARDFEDIINGNAMIKSQDTEATLKDLKKIKEGIEKKIAELEG